MAEYIEREAAIKAIESVPDGNWRSIRYAKEVKAVPAADVRPVVKAYWIGEGDGYADGEMVYDVWNCSNCGYTVDEGDNEPPRYNFCPNCGADMRGEADEKA